MSSVLPTIDVKPVSLSKTRLLSAFPGAMLLPLDAYAHFPPVNIGRPLTIIGAGPHVHLRLRSRAISKKHAVLLNVDGRVAICDLGSRTHVYVNDRLIRRAFLKDGDRIRIGVITFKFVSGPRADVPTSPQAPAAQLRLQAQRVATLYGPLYVIGRRRDSDLALPGPSVGRAHAIIVEAFGRHFMIHLSDHRTTLVNGVKLDEKVLKNDSMIEVGEHHLRYELAAVTEPAAQSPPNTAATSDTIAAATSGEEQSRPNNQDVDSDDNAGTPIGVISTDARTSFENPDPLPLENCAAEPASPEFQQAERYADADEKALDEPLQFAIASAIPVDLEIAPQNPDEPTASTAANPKTATTSFKAEPEPPILTLQGAPDSTVHTSNPVSTDAIEAVELVPAIDRPPPLEERPSDESSVGSVDSHGGPFVAGGLRSDPVADEVLDPADAIGTSVFGERVGDPHRSKPQSVPDWIQRCGPLALAMVRVERPKRPRKRDDSIPPPPRRRGRSVLLAACVLLGVALIGVWYAREFYIH